MFLSAVCPGFLPCLIHVNEIVLVKVESDRAKVTYKPIRMSLVIVEAERKREN